MTWRGWKAVPLWHMLYFGYEEPIDILLNTEEMFKYAPSPNDMWVERLS